MRIRGKRRCEDCGEEWSYYETGEVTCPTCGSLRSVGIESERSLHTDAPAELDLTEVRGLLDAEPFGEVARTAEETTREYVATRGFVHAGDLQPLDGTILAAAELQQAAAHLRRSIDTIGDREEAYFLSLLDGAPDGERPEEVPGSMYAARGLAVITVLEDYRRDVARWLEDNPDEAAEATLGSLREHVKRVEALDGEIRPAEAERLVSAARDLSAYLREGEEEALVQASERLDAP